MIRECRPSFRSLLASVAISASPLLSVAFVLYWQMPHPNAAFWVLSPIVSLFSLLQIAQSFFVHTKRIYLDDYGVEVRSSTRTIMRINYRDISNATLRERVNPISRTDRLIIFEGARHLVSYNVSMLAPKDEQAVLDEIMARAKVVVKQDRPAV